MYLFKNIIYYKKEAYRIEYYSQLENFMNNVPIFIVNKIINVTEFTIVIVQGRLQ
jgi:hypothetical protein